MSSLIPFISTVTCLLLTMKLQTTEGLLEKPVLEVVTNHPEDVIVIGDTISFVCATLSTNTKKFYLHCENTNVTLEQSGSEFIITKVTSSYTGMYTCKYCNQDLCSEYSEPVYVYVRDTFPEPEIIVRPRKTVKPGDHVTIMCNAPYENIKFLLYKGDELIMEDANGGNTFSYEIKHANEQHVGQYMCSYTTKPGNKLQMHSRKSNPMMIRVKVLPKPSISWEAVSHDNGTHKIHCTAPNKYRRMWFQLLNDSKDVEDEIEDINENSVTFTIKDLKHSKAKYYCMYRIQMMDDFVDSIVSEEAFIGEDHTTGNIIRLLLSGMILILIGFIILKHFNNFRETEELPPDLPSARVRYVRKENEKVQ
ncbi:natural cytotoxicity triggering receptor 1-like [Rhinophrynus dorsalis]